MPTPPDNNGSHEAHRAHLQPIPRANRSVYNPLTMGLPYNWFVIGYSHKAFWGIDNATIHDLYEQHMGRIHADVGVGTGHFACAALDRTRRDLAAQQVHLLDNAPAALAATARRVRRRGVAALAHPTDALGTWPLADNSVHSVGSTMMLHCLPGQGFADKARVFTEAARVLAPGGVFFGTSVLGKTDPAPISRRGARARRFYNERKNIFHNTGDTAAALAPLLTDAFGPQAQVQVRTEGATVIWVVMV